MNLLQDNIKKIYLKFLIPSLGSAMVMSVYTLTDAIVIGKGVGPDALAALSITTPLLCILMAAGILFGVGGSVHMNVKRGMGDKKGADMYFSTSLILISIVSLILWILYLVFMPNILRIMGANDILYPYASEYMKYIDWFLPIAVFSNFLAIFARADNDPNRAMLGVIIGGVFNIIFDILLVMVWDFGIGGAALASACGMCIQVLVSGSHFITKKGKLKFVIPKNIFMRTRDVISGGLSGFLNEFANGFIVFLFNIQVLRYCKDGALPVYSVISNCVILFNSLFTGVGQAVQPIISMNFGAGNRQRIKQVVKISYKNIAFMGIVFSAAGIFFPHVVCGAFINENSAIRSIADYAIPLYFVAFIPMGLNVLSSYYFQSVLLTKESVIVSVLRNIVLSGTLIVLLPMVISANMLWMVMPIVETIILFMCVYLRKSRAV